MDCNLVCLFVFNQTILQTNRMGCEVSQQNSSNAEIPQNRYEQKQLIASGTHSKVYRVFDKNNNQDCAKKVIEKLPENYQLKSIRPDFPEYFGKLTSLRHQNLVSYRDIFFSQGQLHITMDFTDKGTLLDHIRSKGKLSQNQTAQIIKKVLEGLYYLHNQGLLHNDLKPSNILLFENNQLKISDYCISQLFDTRLQGRRSEKQPVSTRWDNIPYMAPEVVKNLGATTLSDVWSVGCIVIEMLTGKKPWTTFGNQDQVFKKVASGVVPPLPTQISPTCSNFLQACLAIVPSQRLRVDQLLSHPFLTVSRQKKLQRSKEIPAKKHSFTAPKRMKTQANEAKEQRSGFLIDSIEQIQSPVVLVRTKQVGKSLKNSRTINPSENNSIKLGNQKQEKSKAKQQVAQFSSIQEQQEPNTVILNNRKVKMSKQNYLQVNPQRFSTDAAEWTSPSRVKIKNIKEAKSHFKPDKERDQLDILLANSSTITDNSQCFLPQIVKKEQSRLRIKTENYDQFDKDFYKKPLQLLKRKIQERRAFQNFEERMQTEIRKYSAAQETINHEQMEQSQKQVESFHEYSRSNREQSIIDTEVARLQRDHYERNQKIMMQKRREERLKWENELRSGKEMLKHEPPFRYYIK